ncbi:MAG: CheB methylesterase domain-containing protein [Actinomycetota bacterium]|nr:CheB methylesterase domain-containing protein [Actinomycetota bacterium]
MSQPSDPRSALGFDTPGVPVPTGPFDILVIGASLGGPPAVERVLAALPATFPIPVAIVQHMAAGFVAGWVERLGQHCALRVKEAVNYEHLLPGTVHVAPTGLQMRIGGMRRKPVMRLDPDFSDSLHVPSVDMLMSSAAHVFGSGTLAVLLTGIGSDGACGMLAVRMAGGYTLAESSASAVSYGMPGSAAKLGAVVELLDLERIPARIVELGTAGR